MNKYDTRKPVIIAMLIALQIVFVRFLSIGSGSIRISLGFFPVAVASMLLGPIGGGVVGVLSDIVGMLIFPREGVYFPLFTLNEFLYGVGFGLMLYKKNLSGVWLSSFVALQFIVINLVLTSAWLYLYYILIVSAPQGYWLIFTQRLLAAAVNLPVQILGINLLNKYLREPLARFM